MAINERSPAWRRAAAALTVLAGFIWTAPAFAQTAPAQSVPAASQALPAPTEAQSAYAWHVQERPEGTLALLAACEACGDVPLTLTCTKGSADVTLKPLLPLQVGEENGIVEVIFEVDRDAFRRDGRLGANALTGRLTPEVTVPKGDILLAAMSSGKTLTVVLGPKRLPLPLKGSADALRRLRAGCSTAPAAAPEASATRPQRARRAPAREEKSGSGFSLRGILSPFDPRD